MPKLDADGRVRSSWGYFEQK